MALDDDGSSDTTNDLRQPSPELTTSEFRCVQAQINHLVAANRKYRPRPKARELWDGRRVKIYSNGTVSLWVPWREMALRRYIGSEARTRIEETRTGPTIHFLPEKVVLKTVDEIIFSRSKRQIEKELGSKGYPTLPSEPTCPLALVVTKRHHRCAEQVPTPIAVRGSWKEVNSIVVKEKKINTGGLLCEGRCSF